MFKYLHYIIILLLFINCTKSKNEISNTKEKWVAIHLLDYTNDKKLVNLGKQLPELAKKGLNTIFLEVDYHFDFKSHPELKSKNEYITKKAAQQFKKICDKYNIRLIPQFQSLGHQSWAGTTYELLTVYPELDLTPGAYKNNEGIYCREWDPYNPKVNIIVFPLIDEIIEAFDADGLHIGMDEVFLIGSPFAKSTKDKDPATVFAKVVNDFHNYFSKQKNIDLFIWGDRLIDGKTHKYGEWESSLNGTAPAIDLIPKDIIICDWHYEPRANYSSIPMFIEKGFKVLPSSWRKNIATEKLINYSYQINNSKMLGHLFTTWSYLDTITNYKPFNYGLEVIKNGKFYDVNYNFTYDKEEKNAKISLSSTNKSLDIRYTKDGSSPTIKSNIYSSPIKINTSNLIKAKTFLDTVSMGVTTSQKYVIHKGLESKVELKTPYTEKFEVFSKEMALIDGELGSNGFSDGKWLGFDATDADIKVQLRNKTAINTIKIRAFNDHSNWIYAPQSVTLLTSTNGLDFTKNETKQIPLSKETIQEIAFNISASNIKSIQIICENKLIPKTSKDKGNKTWIFIDEIILD